MEKNEKTLILLDAHAIIHRAYHALPDFLSSEGEPTGALYGLSTMLMKIISELKPDYIVACYDLPGKTFRHEAYEAYKGTRKKTDDALITQLKNSREIFKAFGVPIYDSPGFEADDILGTITAELKKDKNIRIIIASGDMDTMQLVDDKKVQVYTLRKGLTDTIMYDEEKVLERYHFEPKLLPDYKGLRGDPSDNIIGIKGIGDKTAETLIRNFGTIEQIYKKIKKDEEAFKKAGLSPRIIKLIKDNEEEAQFSKTLATIRRDAPIKFSLPKKTFWETADIKEIEKLFAKYEFRSLFSRLEKFFQGKNSGSAEFSQVLGSPGPRTPARPLQNSLSQNSIGELPDKTLLSRASIALWLINSEISNPTLKDILIFAKTDSFDEAYDIIFKKLKEKGLEKVFTEIEEPIMEAVKGMEDYGILIDQKYFKKLSSEYHAELDKLTKKIYSLAGTEFNINSPKQLGEILFGRLGIKNPGKKSASGNVSTKISVLESLEEDNEIVRVIMSYRELQKLLSTYIDVIPKLAGKDGRLHAKFIQTGAATGRFSSQDPNLQNLPIKSELGRRIRNGFVATPGHKLCAFDYSQIELRIAAILSKDPKLTEIFKKREDVHAGVASFVFGVPIEKTDSEMRRKAKVINFGILYGMGVTALKKNLGGTREEAQKFYNNYFSEFSGLAKYLEEVKKFAEEHSYTETLFGRRRNFSSINSRIPFLKAMAVRTAINAPLQGTAADIIKLAIRFAHEDLKKAGLINKAHLILQIHDELVYEIEESALDEATDIIIKAMEGVMARSFLKYKSEIPLLVHHGCGDNLGEVK